MIDFKQIRITHILNGILVLVGVVFSILCMLSIFEKNGLAEDYDRKLKERTDAYYILRETILVIRKI